jgi:hypothetical protein
VSDLGLGSDRYNGRILDHEDRIATLERLLGELPGARPRRNLLDNGAMQIAQRGTATVSVPSSAAIRTADRWYTNNSNAGVWNQDVVDVHTPLGLRRALRMVVTTADSSPSAGDFLVISQGIEGYVMRQAMATTTSLLPMSASAEFHTTLTGTYIIELLQLNAAGSLTRLVSVPVTLPASTWVRSSVPIPADAAASMALDEKKAIIFQVFLVAGSTYTGGGSLNTSWSAAANNTRAVGQVNLAATIGNTFHMTELQLEVGSPTKFERLSYDDDFRRCLRYFQRWTQPPLRGVVSTGANVNRMGMALPVMMRDVPTLSYSGTISFFDGGETRTLSSIGTNYSDTMTVEFDAVVNTGWAVTGRAVVLYQTGTGYMDFTADIS